MAAFYEHNGNWKRKTVCPDR